VHENDLWLYVLEGEMHARVGDEVVKATPGSWVLKPRRIRHTMWNAGPEPARIIELYMPGGFELSSSRISESGCAKGRSGSTN
jgi:mannose-6-phosphate isomerase-like protein (cupin superfamily)